LYVIFLHTLGSYKGKNERRTTRQLRKSQHKHWQAVFYTPTTVFSSDGFFVCNEEGGHMKSIKHLTRSEFEGYFRSMRKPTHFFETEIFAKVIEFVRDDKLVAHVKFANDVNGTPPLTSFMSAYAEFFDKLGLLSTYEKTGLALCFRYIFCVVLNGGYSVKKVRKVGKAADYGIVEASVFTKDKGV